MIHIFDKVYITYAEKFVGPEDETRMPESFLRIIDRGLSFIQDTKYDKHLLESGKNLNEVISKFGNENEMFKKIKEIIDNKISPKFVLFCDEHALLEFSIRWWKYLFPNLDAEGAYSLYQNFAESQTIRGIRTSFFLNISVNSAPIPFHEFNKIYWSENKQIFIDKFNSYPAFQLDPVFKETCSVEFQILNYLVTGNFDSNLSKKIKNFFEKSLIDEITRIIEDAQNYIYELSFHLEDAEKFYFGKKVDLKKLLSNNTYKVIFDPNIKNNKEGFNYLVKNYELKKVISDLLNFYCLIEDLCSGKNTKSSFSDAKFVKQVHDHGLDVDFSKILDEEINMCFKYGLFRNLVYKNRINSYLISSFNNRIKVLGKDEIVNQFKF